MIYLEFRAFIVNNNKLLSHKNKYKEIGLQHTWWNSTPSCLCIALLLVVQFEFEFLEFEFTLNLFDSISKMQNLSHSSLLQAQPNLPSIYPLMVLCLKSKVGPWEYLPWHFLDEEPNIITMKAPLKKSSLFFYGARCKS